MDDRGPPRRPAARHDGVDVAYWTNAVTFLVSAILVARIAASALRSDERLTKGHWRELREGLGLVVSSRPS